ncbi:DUF1692-domain-containing protein [Myriangium duriaei CBS 260.36]|uniref:Endoplasmic reticulum-Golgi intermediate compartment protein n=1 Tax=Myriangium duriaei CBS 260.36 TaxID=1168546 RepID=A0A9P4J7G4_9PEZI|nr:DUF1692-domain-containing protein [Myriangium duriaei CBS 260.36]
MPHVDLSTHPCLHCHHPLADQSPSAKHHNPSADAASSVTVDMNGFADHNLDESAFEAKGGVSVRAFDAFPKTKASYQTKTHSGGVWTVVLALLSFLLTTSELRRWWAGHTTHAFSVEKGVGHELQINLDLVMAMRCDDLRINVQDAAGDRILAGDRLNRVNTMWYQWSGKRGGHVLGATSEERGENDYDIEDVHDYLSALRKGQRFLPNPKMPRGKEPDSCRIYGTLQLNKVQGDFHIMARGHGYMELGQHLDHKAFNFSHQINELSFGPFYPSLTNPLDNTYATTPDHFHKFQYYLSVVPTIYTTDPAGIARLRPATSLGSSDEALKAELHASWLKRAAASRNTVFTNQYAVTEQSHVVPENAIPGVFVKYDMEPILLTIAEEWDTPLALLVRLVNVVSGILVAGGWAFQMSDWAREVLRKGRRRGDSFAGVLHGRTASQDEKRSY